MKNELPRFAEPKQDFLSTINIIRDFIKELGAGRESYSFFSDMKWLLYQDLLRIQAKLGTVEHWNTSKSFKYREIATRFFLGTLAEDVERHGAKLIVVYIPNYNAVTDEIPPMPTFIREEIGLTKAELIDMTPDFSAFKKSHGFEALRVPGDGHMSVAGHEIIAEKIAKFVEVKSLLK